MSVVTVFLAGLLATDAPALYAEHCAGCHGKEGHGDGVTAKDLKYKPRDFREGKFAFGNTPDAMVKTVMSGIPGEEQARMPAFKSVLAVAEIDALVEYVRTMMPVEPVATPTDMRLEPRDRPLVVRGVLAPLNRGDGPIARGLLVGLPSGFSFEYATDDLRLLALRRGDFMTRSDWEGRGGRPLTPLGQVVFTTAQPLGWAPFLVNEALPNSPPGAAKNDGAAVMRPLHARLRSTSVRGGVAELAYDLLDPDGRVRASVRERPRDVVVSDGSGLVQQFEVSAPSPVLIDFSFAAPSDPELGLPQPTGASPVTGENVAVKHAAEQASLAQATGWYVVRGARTSAFAVRFELPERGRVVPASTPDRDVLDAWVTVDAKPVTLSRIVIARESATLEQLEKMTTETKELR